MHPKRSIYAEKKPRSRPRRTRNSSRSALSRPFWGQLQSLIQSQWCWWQTIYWQSQNRHRPSQNHPRRGRNTHNRHPQRHTVPQVRQGRSSRRSYRPLGLPQLILPAIAYLFSQQLPQLLAQRRFANPRMASCLISLFALGSSFLITFQLTARANYVQPQTLLFQEPAIDVLHLPPLGIFWLSGAEIEQKSGELFATPNSIGAIALGAAEGTRTQDGSKTLIWKRHTDPGNGAENKGTFAWQLGAATPEEADLKGLARIRYEAIPYLIRQAEQDAVGFDIATLIHGADLWNQSPNAGADFVRNLNRCLHRDLQDDNAIILCARIESFYNPETAELEASGFNSDPERLEEDQIRRMQAIQQVLQQNQEQISTVFQHPEAAIF